jgi:hypothetical protein
MKPSFCWHSFIFALILVFAASFAHGQIVRWDLGSPGSAGAVTTSGTGLASLQALPGVSLNWCNYPANSSGSMATNNLTPCTNFATTYTDLTGATSCPTNAPIVLQGSSSCVNVGDNFGNMGVYTAPNSACAGGISCWSYTLTYAGVSSGPFTYAPSGGGGSSSSSLWNALLNPTANLNLSMNTFVSDFVYGDFGASPVAGGFTVTDTATSSTDTTPDLNVTVPATSYHNAGIFNIAGFAQLQICNTFGSQHVGITVVGSAIGCPTLSHTPVSKFWSLVQTNAHTAGTFYVQPAGYTGNVLQLHAVATGSGFNFLTFCPGASAIDASCSAANIVGLMRGDGLFNSQSAVFGPLSSAPGACGTSGNNDCVAFQQSATAGTPTAGQNYMRSASTGIYGSINGAAESIFCLANGNCDAPVSVSTLSGQFANDECDKFRYAISLMAPNSSAQLSGLSMTVNQNCAVSPYIDLYGTGMAPVKNGQILLGNVNLTTCAPIVAPGGWLTIGLGPQAGANSANGTQITASNSCFPATYNTGTVATSAGYGGLSLPLTGTTGAASGGNTTYSFTCSGGCVVPPTNGFAGTNTYIQGFTASSGANNGLYNVVSNTTTTITVNNANGVSETHAGTAQLPYMFQVTGSGTNFTAATVPIGATYNTCTSAITGPGCTGTPATNQAGGTIPGVAAIVSTTVLNVITNSAVTANAAGKAYNIWSNLTETGDYAGNASQNQNFNAGFWNMSLNSNGVLGVSTAANYSSSNLSITYKNIRSMPQNIGFDFEGAQAQQSAAENLWVIGQTSQCTGNTMGMVIRTGSATMLDFRNFSSAVTQCNGGAGTNVNVAIDSPGFFKGLHTLTQTGSTLGAATVSGANVTWSSGQHFSTAWTQTGIILNGTTCTISSINSTTSITLTGSCGSSGNYSLVPSGDGVLWGGNPGCGTVMCFTAASSISGGRISHYNEASASLNGLHVSTNGNPVNYGVEGVENAGTSPNWPTNIYQDDNAPCTIPRITEPTLNYFYWNIGGRAFGSSQIANCGGLNTAGPIQAATIVANQGTACAAGNFVLSGGWGATAAVSNVSGYAQDCQLTITSGTSGYGSAPTVTYTLPTPLPSVMPCSMTISKVSGIGSPPAIYFDNSTQSATVPVFTATLATGAAYTPAANQTYKVVVQCGP